MRKLLLAGAAGLGLWGAVTTANAQTATTTAPMSSGGTVTGYSAGSSFPTLAPPNPGTVVVRLNGRVRFYAGAAWDRDANNLVTTAASNNVATSGTTVLSTATSKVNSYGFLEYGRLYPGFDGVAANGLKYGANMEIRQDAASGAGGARGASSISGQDPARGELYFRRVWGYLGTNQLGTLRVGAVDPPTSLYLTGNFENFNDGGWNGDAPAFIAGGIGPVWPFADVGSWYTTNKVVYLSPSLFGFDLGASYEPTTANVNGGSNCGTVGGNTGVGTNGYNAPSGINCDNLSSSPFNAAAARRRNTFEVLVRYRGSFGPVGIAATAAYDTSSHVSDNSGLPYSNNPFAVATFANGQAVPGAASGSGIRYNYDGLSIGDFGGTATIGGLAVGGHYMFGRYNGQIGTLVPKGLPDSDAYVIGASYTFGPTIIGAHYFVSESAGELGNAYFGRQRREYGIAAGGTYALAPGVSIYLSGLYGERKQNGYDFVNNLGVTTTNAATGGTLTNNKVTSSAVSIGTSFAW